LNGKGSSIGKWKKEKGQKEVKVKIKVRKIVVDISGRGFIM